jgi:prepilin-type N-terminal cleavage/methylation domain-containing protein
MKKRIQGFTLVELLVVIGIIATLIGLLLPAVGRARQSAQEIRSLSGMRQMMIGYTQYSLDNHGAVLYGYTPTTVCGVPVTVYDPLSRQTFGLPVADRFPWRLLPYVGNLWQILHSHADLPPIPQDGDSASTAFTKAYTLSLNPTYGINAVYVGGQNGGVYQGFTGPSGDIPNTGHHVVFKANEVRHPSELIVFADCHCYNVPGLGGEGLHYLTPPYANGHNWQIVNGQIQLLNTNLIMGIPQGWYSQRIVVGFFDGHAETLLPSQLADMRLWANWADSPNYDFVQ